MDVGGATTTTKMTSTMNKITYFCVDSECDKKVATYGAPCCLEHNPLVGGLDDSVSCETSECPGCGMDLYVGANGYCSHCWVDRFGTDEAPPCSPVEHECCGEWDYDRGVHVCDFADEPECPQHRAQLARGTGPDFWQCRSESEIRQNCECKKSPLCRLCEVYYGYADEDPYDGCTYDCTNCKREFKNKYSRNQSLCRDCEDLPPLPVSPMLTEQEAEWLEIQELEEQIAKIKEKVELYSGGMTSRQVDDWRLLWMTKEKRLRELRCWGCCHDILNQQGHMGPGGCLEDERENPLEDWDEADLRKLDVQMRYGF